MAINLPPFPANATPGGFVWTDWWKKFQQYVQEVTEVAGQGTSPIPGSGGLPGLQMGDAKWLVVANFLKFELVSNISGDNSFTWNNQWFNLGSSSRPMPIPVNPSPVLFVAYQNNPNPHSYSVGIGAVDGGWTYGPRITAPNGTVPSGFDTLTIQGWYFVS